MPNLDSSAPRRRVPPIDVALYVVVLVAATWSWVDLERTSGFGPAVLVWLVAFGGVIVVAAGIGVARRPDGLAALVDGIRTVRRTMPYREQMHALGVPTGIVWLLPVATIVPLALTLPVAFHTSPGDWSILGVAAVFVFLLAYFAMLLGGFVWVTVAFPVLLLFRVLTRAVGRGRLDTDDRYAVGLAALLLAVVTLACTWVIASPGPPGTTRTTPQQIGALFGTDGDVVRHPLIIWIARLALVAVVAVVVALFRVGRRSTAR